MFKPLLLAALIATHASASVEQDSSVHRAAESIPDNTFKVVAIPFYDPSVSAGISIVPIYAFHAGDGAKGASTLSAAFTLTENGSYYVLGNTDLLLNNDQFRFISEFGFRHTKFDLGLPSPEESFGLSDFEFKDIPTTEDNFSFDGDLFYRLFDNFYFGAGINFSSSSFIGDTKLDQFKLRLLGLTEDYQSDIGARVSFMWDKREHYYLPSNGFAWKLAYEEHREWVGNDADKSYSAVSSDFRHFFSLNETSNHVIASKWVGRYLLDADQAPTSAYTTYGRQGKETQRGFVVGDYTASHMVNAEIEYRYSLHDYNQHWLNKMAVVGIAGAGKVFGEQLIGDKVSFNDAETLSMLGIGLRYAILPKERINIRMDVTYNSDNEVLAYFSLGESI